MTQSSRLYGIYIHNLTDNDNKFITLEAVNRLLKEKGSMRYEYGDVIVMMPNDEVGALFGEICQKNGFIVEYIHPNQLYRLIDSMVVHYVFVKDYLPQKEVEQYVFEWEVSMGLTQQDMRYTRYIKTFFMKS